MLYVVVEEIWSTDIEAKLLSTPGSLLFARDKEAAEEHARQCTLAYPFRGSEHNADYPYWWGREHGKRENHRFLVKPAVSSE